MTWRLIIDDDVDTVREPSITVDDPVWRDGMNLPREVPDVAALGPWVKARNVAEAVRLIEEKGMPLFVTFDHDLGDGIDSPVLVNWIKERDLDLDFGFIPEGFSYEVHSGNRVGRENIRGLLDGYLSFREAEIAERAEGQGTGPEHGA